jgi:amino acid adenylation domain-containing protein
MSSDHGIARRIVAIAAQTPHATALAGPVSTISYHELEIRANQLAHHLCTLGVVADGPVALLLQRSPEAVLAALGILKAGGAYLPLDPSYPRERLAFMLADAGVRVIVTDARVPHAPEGPWQIVRLDAGAEQFATQPQFCPEVAITPDHLAYVIYTSGSTGQPKGVLIRHGSLSNLIDWHIHAFGVTADDRASQLASFGFDAAVWEVWPYLAAGASVHFVREAARTDPEALRDWLLENRINIGFVPTALAEHMIAMEWPAKTALRYLLTGADTLRRYPPAALPFQLVNNYGPTECTVVSTSGVVAPAGSPDQAPSIGKPILNFEVHIVDANLRPVDPGQTGELLIGGPGLARGYLNRPELTAEKFVRDPFDASGERRLYRTGDLARFLPDGRIAFAGRIDNQVKVRGYRIEPDEIASVLMSYPAVRSAHVVTRENSFGEKFLVAYVVGACVDDRTLKSFLQTRLPDYMVPAELIWLDRLPLTSSGKLDQSALTASEPAVKPSQSAEVRARLSEILTGLLGVKEIGGDDNFFELGGSSLLGPQLIARIRESFGVELTLRKLFQAPTVSGLAKVIQASHPKLPGGGAK